MSTSRETHPHLHRPPVRRLSELDNTELQALFVLRSSRIAAELNGHQFWDNPRIVYWNKFLILQADLYEVMLEIQRRYPKDEIKGYELLLPLPNTQMWRERDGVDFEHEYAEPIWEGVVRKKGEQIETTNPTNRHNLPGRRLSR